MEKPVKNLALFRISAQSLTKEKQRNIKIPSYLCEKLPKKAVIFYAELTMRVKTTELAKHMDNLSEVDFKILQKAQTEKKTWQAHCIGRRHKLITPIPSSRGHENFKYLDETDPIVVQLLAQNQRAKKYMNENKVNWILLTIKPSFAKVILHGIKHWEFRVGITKVPEESNQGHIRQAVYNPFKWGKQPLIIKGNRKEKTAKTILAYIYEIIEKLQIYISSESGIKTRYIASRDTFVIYVLHHLQQFHISPQQVFSSVPLKISWHKFKDQQYSKVHRKTWQQLTDTFDYGTAESMS